MNIEEYRDYCLQKKGVSEEFPFDADILVFKVGGKIFALTDVNSFASINLKCDPEKAVELREQFPEVRPGYHMNKKHWNTVDVNGSLSDKQIKEWIDHSYQLVVQSLPAKTRKELENA